jgi:hypothetical protein
MATRIGIVRGSEHKGRSRVADASLIDRAEPRQAGVSRLGIVHNGEPEGRSRVAGANPINRAERSEAR